MDGDEHPTRSQSADSSTGASPRVWVRGNGPEFDRVAMFSDAVFAIALTLLALDLRVDHVAAPVDAPRNMLAALNDLTPKLVAYGVGFLLMGRQWMVHHRFFGLLTGVNRPMISLNLTYLAFVALLPFPTSLIGEYEGNPISAVAFSLNLAAIGFLGAMMLRRADHFGLIDPSVTPEAVRWTLINRLIPVAMFVLTIPLAFISPTVQLLSWLPISIINGMIVQRIKPASVGPDDEA